MSSRSRASLALALCLGFSSSASADVAGVWNRLTPAGTPPPGRMATAHIYDAAHDRVIVFGGYGHRNFYNDAWALELSPTLRWVQLPSAPVPGRHETTAIVDPTTEQMLIFGGKNLYGFFGDLLSLHLDTDPPTWSIVDQGSNAPGPRETRAVLDPGRRRFITALGFQPYTHIDDAWSFDLDGGGWTQFAPGPGPIARRGQSAALDGGLDRMLVFGGSDDYNWWNEVWSLDLANPSWTKLDPIGTQAPSGRYGQNMVHDPVQDRLVMFGGYGPTVVKDSTGSFKPGPLDFLNDTWVLELTGPQPRWSRVDAGTDVPTKRDFFALVWDQGHERALLFGGNGGLDNETNDVWELTFPRNLPSLDAPPLRGPALAVLGARARPGALEVSFRLHDAAPARLEAFDASGRRIGSLDVGSLGAGQHTASLARRDGSAAGLFWIRLTRGEESNVRKVALY